MSETQNIAPPALHQRLPTVYFIDDSATMREVIKIAFRKENVHIIACADAASALAQFGSDAPDAVITDVIMPDKDGYQVCEFIKQHAQLAQTPVLLMSGVVNRDVAEKAMAVKADDLIRKPFQPQDLVARVKTILAAKFPPAAAGVSSVQPTRGVAPTPNAVESEKLRHAKPAQSGPNQTFADLFNPSLAASSPNAGPFLGSSGSASPWSDRPAPSMSSVAVTPSPRPAVPLPPSPASIQQYPGSSQPQSSAIGLSDSSTSSTGQQPRASSQPPLSTSARQPAPSSSAELQRLRSEILRLELLVKKLQAELEAEHQYCAALESHFKSLQE